MGHGLRQRLVLLAVLACVLGLAVRPARDAVIVHRLKNRAPAGHVGCGRPTPELGAWVIWEVAPAWTTPRGGPTTRLRVLRVYVFGSEAEALRWWAHPNGAKPREHERVLNP